jgi:hypothetical protein
LEQKLISPEQLASALLLIVRKTIDHDRGVRQFNFDSPVPGVEHVGACGLSKIGLSKVTYAGLIASRDERA